MKRPRHALGRWTRWRRTCQLAVAMLYLGLPLVQLLGVRAVGGNLAALRIGSFDLVEPAAGLSAALAGQRLTTSLLLGMAPAVLLALALGPVFCSWVCPWGLISEGIHRLRYRRRPWHEFSPAALRKWRLLILGGMLGLGALLGTPLVAMLSAPRLITTLPYEVLALRVVPAVTGALLLGLLLLELLGPRRLWCRVLCPVGTMATVLRSPRALSVRFESEACRCPGTPPCQLRCPWGIDPRRMQRADGCTNCFTCLDTCSAGALAWGSGQGVGPRTGSGATSENPKGPSSRLVMLRPKERAHRQRPKKPKPAA